MSLRQEIRVLSADLNAPDLLRHLLEEKFSEKVVVIASLMAPSVVVLKMIAEIPPITKWRKVISPTMKLKRLVTTRCTTSDHRRFLINPGAISGWATQLASLDMAKAVGGSCAIDRFSI